MFHESQTHTGSQMAPKGDGLGWYSLAESTLGVCCSSMPAPWLLLQVPAADPVTLLLQAAVPAHKVQRLLREATVTELVRPSLRPAVSPRGGLQWAVLVSSLAGRSGCRMSVPSSRRRVSPWWSGGGCPCGPARGKCTLCTHQVPEVHSNDKVLKDD